MCAYISAQGIRFSQRSVTSIDALSSPKKRASEWEMNCQTMHSSHPLLFSSCQMISKHYRMSGCIIYRTPPPLSSPHPPPRHPSWTLWWICRPATKGSMKWQDLYHFICQPFSSAHKDTCSILVGSYDINIRELISLELSELCHNEAGTDFVRLLQIDDVTYFCVWMFLIIDEM